MGLESKKNRLFFKTANRIYFVLLIVIQFKFHFMDKYVKLLLLPKKFF